MPGINLFTNLWMCKQLALQDGSSGADISLKDHSLIFYINEGYRWLSNETQIDLSQQATLDLVAGTSEYAMPADRLGWDIEEIRILDSAGVDDGALTYRLHSFMREEYGMIGTGQDNGKPTDWAISRSDPTKIVIMPPPDYSRSDSLVLYYTRNSQVDRIYKPVSITLSVTKGATTATLSSSGWETARIAAGDEIAVQPASQFDGTVMTGVFDSRFYTIESIASTTVTFTEAFAGPTQSTRPFVSGQVHPIDKTFPGKYGFAAAYWASNLICLSRGETDRAKIYENMAFSAIANKGKGHSNITDHKPEPRRYLSWLS